MYRIARENIGSSIVTKKSSVVKGEIIKLTKHIIDNKQSYCPRGKLYYEITKWNKYVILGYACGCNLHLYPTLINTIWTHKRSNSKYKIIGNIDKGYAKVIWYFNDVRHNNNLAIGYLISGGWDYQKLNT